MRNIDLWYTRLDVAGIVGQFAAATSGKEMKRFRRSVAALHTKDSLRALSNLCRKVGRLTLRTTGVTCSRATATCMPPGRSPRRQRRHPDLNPAPRRRRRRRSALPAVQGGQPSVLEPFLGASR
jgi:hypothetical protein